MYTIDENGERVYTLKVSFCRPAVAFTVINVAAQF